MDDLHTPLPPRAPEEFSKPPIGREDRNWAMACHLSALSGYFTFFGFFLGPLLVWLFKKEGHPLVDDQGKEALNFQLSLVVYYIAAGLLVLVLVGIPLLIALAVFQLVETVIASVKAKEGVPFRYPLTIRFVT